jgi:sporulation protein YlmC with PRC-barrel domain
MPSGVHVGDVHNVTLDIDKLNIAIDHSKVSEAEKTEAKGLL